MNDDERIEAALRRRPADEREYDEPLAVLMRRDGGVQRVKPVTRSRVRTGALPAVAAIALVAALGAGAVAVGVWRGAGQPSGGNSVDYQLTGKIACYGQGPGGTPNPAMVSSETCPLMAVPPAGYTPATWALDPSVPFSAESTEIHVLVQEQTCASGRTAEGRIAQNVDLRADAVVVTLAVRSREGLQTCQGNPPTPYVLHLGQPVGNRMLQDGGRWPAATLASGGRAVVASNPGAPSASPSAPGSASVTLAPDGMLPLGPTRSLNQPPAPCGPGIPGGVQAPGVYPADVVTYYQAQMGGGAAGEVVNYDWGGHRPLAADSLHVRIPDLSNALRVGRAGMRLVVGTSDGVCFASWGVTARSVTGYDGSQDPGSWELLGDGAAAADAVVVGALPEGDWIVHIHLAYTATKETGTYTSESYARVVVGGRVEIPAVSVPAPDPAVDCTGKSLQAGHVPQVALTVDGAATSAGGVLGIVSTTQSGPDSPPSLPTEVVSMKAGELFTIRTTDGSCGNDWGGLYFFPVPDSLGGPIGGSSGLPSNHGGPPNPATIPLVGAIRGAAPAQGAWLLGAVFWFGGPNAVTYYWRISVS
jgi:hypothetical protein